MKRYSQWFVILSMGSAAILHADPDPVKEPLPPGPWPSRAPKMSAWTVKMTYGSSGQSMNSQVQGSGTTEAVQDPNGQEVQVIKTWPVVHELVTKGNGDKWNKWYQNGVEVCVAPAGQILISRNDVRDPFLFQDYSHLDFAYFEWLSAQTYKGTDDYKGKKCFVFEAKMRTTPNGSPILINESSESGTPNVKAPQFSSTEFTVKAYLDHISLLPVHLEYGDQAFDFEFGATPQGIQSFPANITKCIADAEMKKKAAEAKPDRPF